MCQLGFTSRGLFVLDLYPDFKHCGFVTLRGWQRSDGEAEQQEADAHGNESPIMSPICSFTVFSQMLWTWSEVFLSPLWSLLFSYLIIWQVKCEEAMETVQSCCSCQPSLFTGPPGVMETRWVSISSHRSSAQHLCPKFNLCSLGHLWEHVQPVDPRCWWKISLSFTGHCYLLREDHHHHFSSTSSPLLARVNQLTSCKALFERNSFVSVTLISRLRALMTSGGAQTLHETSPRHAEAAEAQTLAASLTRSDSYGQSSMPPVFCRQWQWLWRPKKRKQWTFFFICDILQHLCQHLWRPSALQVFI